ncbi:MAG TPA: hypothetical protein VF792_05125 [Ktedonobacterales bacterium]
MGEQESSAESSNVGATNIDANETPSVTGHITDAGATLAPAPVAASDQAAGAGDLRPVWPAGRRGKGDRVSRRYALSARIAATLCALLYFYVCWAPLANAITSGDLRIAATGPEYRFSLIAAEFGAPPLVDLFGDSFFIWWSLLTVLGLLLAPLLWQSSIRWLRWVASTLYALWFIAISWTLASTAQLILFTLPTQLHAGAGPYKMTLYPYGTRVAVFALSPAYGLWLALLGAVIGLAVLPLAIQAMRKRRAATVPVTPVAQGEIVTQGDGRSTRSLPGAGAITGGLILWAWGFFLLPWATLNCSKAPLLIGTCQGLQVTSALEVGLNVIRAYFDPSAALYALTGLLVTGALAIVLAVWRRDITRTLCIWASAWLALALGCAGLAISGAQQVVHDSASVGLPSGDWRGDTGVLVVFLALLLVAIGLLPLWAVAVRASQRREAERQSLGA